MLDEHGLVASLRWHAKQFTERTGIRVEVRGPESLRLGLEAEIALFRIAQEALTNVARHSRAKNAVIELRDAAGEAVFTLQDDGVGVVAAPDRLDKAGYGLVTMRERAEAVGGSFEASSGNEPGMRITVTMPRKPV